MDFNLQSGYLAVRGEISGIPDYLFPDTPAASGATRLRARIFRVAAYARLIAREINKRCGGSLVEMAMGDGQFLLAGPADDNAERAVGAYQAELDQWSLRELRGELICYLASARCESEQMPQDTLQQKIDWRRGHPLEAALVAGARWNVAAFRSGWGDSHAVRCPACAATVTDAGASGVCQSCSDDEELGKAIASSAFAQWTTEQEGTVRVPGQGLSLGVAGDWAVVEHLPNPDFSELAARSQGHSGLLGYVALEGSLPEVQAARFQNVFCIRLNANHLVAIGPWNDTLRFAIAVAEQKPALSAGVVLAHPQASLRSSKSHAQWEARRAGEGKVSLFGEVLDWKLATDIVDRGFEMASWLKEDRIGTSGLRRIGELHRMSHEGQQSHFWKQRYLPLLVWQSRDADRLLRRKILRLAADRGLWENTGLVAELALLASGNGREKVKGVNGNG